MSGVLTTDINPPDYETRIAILRKKAELENFIVPDEIIILLLPRFNPISGSWKVP